MDRLAEDKNTPGEGRERMTEQIKHIAVIGAGYMGGGIAQVFGMAGMDVVIMDADPDITARHLDRLRQEAEDFENRGLLRPGSAELVRKNLRAANSVAEAVADADLSKKRSSNGLTLRGQCCAALRRRPARTQ